MLWPERASNWRRQARPAQAAFARAAAAIAASERVVVGVSGEQFERARSILPHQVHVLEIESDDAWMRDVGPTFVINTSGDLRGVDWRFNAWGGLYADWRRDESVARRVLEYENCKRYEAPVVVEGGAFHVDGEGTLITTEQCLLGRNPKLSKLQLEEVLRDYVGARRVIWLPRGLPGDETHGHVDNLCCFVAPGEVLLTWCDDPAEPQYEISREAYERLLERSDARGRELRVHKLVHPRPQYRSADEALGITPSDGAMRREEGALLTASYVNFYIGNKIVAAPTFGLDSDDIALRQLQALFPTRQVVGIPSREILLGGGNIHCITQQIPVRGSSRRRDDPLAIRSGG